LYRCVRSIGSLNTLSVASNIINIFTIVIAHAWGWAIGKKKMIDIFFFFFFFHHLLSFFFFYYYFVLIGKYITSFNYKYNGWKFHPPIVKIY